MMKTPKSNMASKHFDHRRVNGCSIQRKRFCCRSKEGKVVIVMKKTVDRAIPSPGDSSCFVLESRRRSAEVEKQWLPGKKRERLEATPATVLSKKRGFDGSGSDASVGYGNVDDYEFLDAISRGSYGVVYRGMEKKTGRMVAIKEELGGFCESSSREIDILKLVIHHPSFVEFRKVVVDEQNDEVYVVMEYIENDLGRALKSMQTPFNEAQVKALMKQLLEGVCFLHENGIMHRDLKPSNILLNNKGELKICDFGLSRHFEREFDCYSPRVGTLWYKAPELLLGAEKYSCAIDMWAVGCIMAELLLEESIFNGTSEIDQLQRIFGILGTPDDIIWPGFSSLPGSRLKFVEQPSNMLSMNFTILSGLGIDLLNKLLVYDPEERITAKDAIKHGWFREIILD